MATISHQLKVLEPVIFSVAVDVVDNFPPLKRMSERPRHDKSVYGHIPSPVGHREVDAGRVDPESIIPTHAGPAASPCLVLGTYTFTLVAARDTAVVYCNTTTARSPSFLAAINTGVPNRSVAATTAVPFNISNLRHIISIPYPHRTRKGESN